MRLSGWFLACHPGPCAVIALGAGLLGVAAGLPPSRVALVAAAVLAGQLSIGWSNDWFDAPRDTAAGRTDKPVASGAVPVRAVAVSALVAAGLTVGLSLWLGLLPGLLHLVAVAAGWLYNWPLKATMASVLAYLVGFGLLPGFVVTAGGGTPPWWLLTGGALLGAGAHFANVLSDLAEDLSTGVRGLPHLVGAAASRVIAVALLLATGAVLVFGPGRPVGWGGWLVVAGSAVALVGAVLARRRYGERLLFRVVLAVALVDVALLLTSPL
ncbi:MAG: UbiA family prenyltransferase [Micromonosporaceae bacterium]